MKKLIATVCVVLLMLSIIPAAGAEEWENEIRREEEGICLVQNKKGMWGMTDLNGNILVETNVEFFGACSDGLIAAYCYANDEDGDNHFCTGYYDYSGNLVIPFFIGSGEDFSDGYAARSDGNGGQYFIDKTGAAAWDGQKSYDWVTGFSEGFAAVSEGGKAGYITTDGSFAWQRGLVYSDVGKFSGGLAPVKAEKYFGYINTQGEIVIKEKFKYAYDFEYGLAHVVFKNDDEGVIDTTGKTLLRLETALDLVIKDEKTIINDGQYYLLEDGQFNLVEEVSTGFDKSEYYPNEGKKVVTLDGKVTLEHIPDHDRSLPRVDGATALFPMYSAFVQAVYPASTRYEEPDAEKGIEPLITCTKTDGAYERLTNGEADIIFVAGPSDAQIAQAAEKGVEFELTHIANEAFVFFVNKDNPVNGMTLDDIRKVYSGQITDWSQLGADNLGEIIAYQRPAGSGSQTALERLMEGWELIPAVEDEVAWDMGSIVGLVEYRDFPNALGYSFRFYVTGLLGADVKLLELDGVAPTVENIASGIYPQTTKIYAVTRKGDDNPNLKAFLDWVVSKQGMELVEKSGYVPVK